MSEEPVLRLGDCLDVLRELEPDSIEACVTDPPYGISFMNRKWDHGVPTVELWREVYRVLKPGAHLLSFFGTRTYHRGVCAIEDAGFEIRDSVQWIYGSGFPKSLDVSKAIDKTAGAEREVVGQRDRYLDGRTRRNLGDRDVTVKISNNTNGVVDITAPATAPAKQWDGWGTALKPAHEPIVVARKPLTGTVASNVLEHGCGGLNIDGCRIAGDMGPDRALGKPRRTDNTKYGKANEEINPQSPLGRWPANVIHDGSDEVLAEFAKYGESSGYFRGNPSTPQQGRVAMGKFGEGYIHGERGYQDTGTAARFFYTAKASKAERDNGLGCGTAMPVHRYGAGIGEGKDPDAPSMDRNHHPTVKPIELMRYLCRLVTPKGGTVLDPFAGSGSTLIAAYHEGFRSIGIERDSDYFEMATERVKNATAQMMLAL
jgi:site-specific DNA-methyltransferase (adenine-specific)